MEFKKVFSLKVKQIRWRKHNRHNSTYVASNFNISKVSVGKETYGPLIIRQYDNNATLQIGNYCSIADEVVFLLGQSV